MKFQHSLNRVQSPLCLFLGAAALYFFVANVSQYFFVGDDAYISFRYARNLADGYGLVWNPGEAVEGYTNFLWVILMAGGIFFNISPEVASTAISIACAALLLIVFLYCFSRLHGANSPWTWLPLVALSLSGSFTAWSTSGLETMFLTLLIFVAFMLFLHERESASEAPVLSSAVFALATLTRPDGGIFMALAGLFFLVDILSKRRSVRSGVIWALPFIAIVGCHFLWRFSYYGFWLPNTFYVKVGGILVSRGLRYLELFVTHYQLYWFLPLFFFQRCRYASLTSTMGRLFSTLIASSRSAAT